MARPTLLLVLLLVRGHGLRGPITQNSTADLRTSRSYRERVESFYRDTLRF